MMWEFLGVLFWLAVGCFGVCMILAIILILAFIIGSIRRRKRE